MASYVFEDFPHAYKVVITRTLKGHVEKHYAGPYMSLGVAKGQATQLRKKKGGHFDTHTVHVERTTGTWEKVED